MDYIKTKDFAKILYFFYQNYFNNFEIVFKDMKITDKQRNRYSAFLVAEEEVWAYEKNVIELDTNGYSKYEIVDVKREFYVGKREFLLALFKPVYIIMLGEDVAPIYADEIFALIIQKRLGKGLFDFSPEFLLWIKEDAEKISVADAEVFKKNLIDFFENEKYRC